MKTLPKISPVSILLLIFISAEGIADQKPEWKGKIEYKNGVKVIKNPREPLYGKIKFELKEDLCIRNEEDENYLFWRVQGVDVDKYGNIYIADMSKYRIQKYK